MSNTPNYNLYLTDDSSTRFQEWRNQMNGTENSNMVKIDAALGEKANSSVAINTNLLATDWGGVEAPSTLALTLRGRRYALLAYPHDLRAYCIAERHNLCCS